MHLTEFNLLIASRRDGAQKTRGEKMKVSLAMLMKTHVEKMSDNGLSTMFMKTNGL